MTKSQIDRLGNMLRAGLRDEMVLRMLDDLYDQEEGRRTEARQRRLAVQLSAPKDEGRFEIVLLEGSSRGAIEETHARYFAKSVIELADRAKLEVEDRAAQFAGRENNRKVNGKNRSET